MHGNVQPLAGLGNGAWAGSHAPHRQVAAQFNPVGAPLPGRQRSGQPFHTNLHG